MKYSFKKIATSFLRLLLSHVGTLVLIILYLVAGGFLFIYLERDNEISSCITAMNIYYTSLNETVLRAITISKTGYNDSVLYDSTIIMLNDFASKVFSLRVTPNMNCSTIGTSNNLGNWNFANTVFFCATLITTIGYGNIYPLTQWGRIVCIIYSFIGIILMLIFLSNFGELLADVFRYVFYNLCCCRCFLRIHKESEVEITKASLEQSMKDHGILLTDLTEPGANKVIIKTTDDLDDEDISTVTIPIIVITSFVALYMLIGASIFKIWEDWDYVAGMYFSFITISTIGLGDLYPSKDRTITTNETVELIAAAIYCLFGLAILSMCLNLIQQEISAKLQWLGEKIGLNSYEEDTIDECTAMDYYEDNTKPIVLKRPFTASVEVVNEAYDCDEEDTVTKNRASLYPTIN